jgi:hypothetical protein
LEASHSLRSELRLRIVIVHKQQILRPKTGVSRIRLPQSAREQSTSHQHDKAQCDLQHDYRLAPCGAAGSANSRRRSSARSSSRLEILAHPSNRMRPAAVMRTSIESLTILRYDGQNLERLSSNTNAVRSPLGRARIAQAQRQSPATRLVPEPVKCRAAAGRQPEQTALADETRPPFRIPGPPKGLRGWRSKFVDSHPSSD